MLNGAIRCFKAAEVVRKNVLVDKAGVMKRNLTRYKIYDELNRVGTVRDNIFRLAREFDPDAIPKLLLNLPKNEEQTTNESNPFVNRDPAFQPDNPEYREYVAAEVTKIRESKGGKASQFAKFLGDPKLNAARLGSSDNFKHEPKKLPTYATSCVVCCKKCPDEITHKRNGCISWFQCSICLVTLCVKPQPCLGGKTCFELWHNLVTPPDHPFTTVTPDLVNLPMPRKELVLRIKSICQNSQKCCPAEFQQTQYLLSLQANIS